MSDFLQECDMRRCKEIANLGGIQVGDFVQVAWRDTWMEVLGVCDWDSGNGPTGSLASSSCRSGTELFFFHNVRTIHRKDDPWDLGEVRYVVDTTGAYGGRGEPPVPNKHLYSGPIRLKAWAWKYRRYAYTRPSFRNPVRNEQFSALSIANFAQRVGEPFENLNWKEAVRIAEILAQMKDTNGWRPCVTYEAMESYNRTIKVPSGWS